MSDERSQFRTEPGSSRRRLVRAGVFTLVAVLVLACAVLAGLRILLAEIGHLRPEIEQWVSGIFEREVRFDAIDAHWNGWTPVLRISDVRLAGGEPGDRDDMESPLRLAEVSFSIDPVESLRLLSVQPFDISARGASIVVVREHDGTFSVQGLGEPAAGGPDEGGTRFVLWALDQPRLSLFESQAVWIDRRSGSAEVALGDVTLHVLRGGGGYRFSGSFVMPEAGWVEFAVDVDDSPLAPSWTGEVYTRLDGVGLDHTGLNARRLGGERFAGRVSGEVWSTWTREGFVEAEGTVRAETPGVVEGQIRRGFDALDAGFRIERVSDGWKLAVRDLVVSTPRGEWPRTSIGARWTPARGGEDGIVVVSADHARLDDLMAVLAPHDTSASPELNALIASAPRGSLEDLHISAPLTERIEFERTRARGRFVGLGLGRETDRVSIVGANGRFEASAQGLVADAETGKLQFNLPRWFSHPLRGESLTGTVTALPSPEGLRIRFEQVNVAASTGAMAAHGWVLAPRDRRGLEFDLNLDVGPSKVAAARALLAGRVLPEPVAEWLENAASDGDVREAHLVIRHRSSQTPASRGATTIEAVAELSFPSFLYARGWPELADVSGSLRWRNGRRLEVQIASGRILDSNIRTGSIVVSDMDTGIPKVEVRGSAEGASTDLVRFLVRSPLRSRFAPVFDGWTIGGDSTVDFDLGLRFEGGRAQATAGGRIVLADNRISIPMLGRDIEAVAGAIEFDNATVGSDGLTAVWREEPLHAVIAASPESGNAVRLSIEGRMTRRMLAEYLHDAGVADTPRPEDYPLLNRIDGDAAFNVTLDIPAAGVAGHAWRLHTVASLDGVAVDLPAPFGKPAESAREFVIESVIAPDSESVVHVRYDDLANAVFGLARDAGRLRLDRGMIRLDAQPATMPDTTGVTVYGAVPALDGGDWLELLGSFGTGTAPDAGPSAFDHIRELSISAESVTAIGARFPDSRIQGKRGADGAWNMRVSGPNLEGRVTIPRDRRAEPLSAELDWFVLEPDSAATRPNPLNLDPAALPGISLSAGKVVLGRYDLGSVRLKTVPSEDGMKIERFEVQTPGYRGDGSGTWSLGDAGHRTELDVRIHGDDLGRMLDGLGYDGSAVDGGVTDVSAAVSWPGTPADLAPQRLRGVLHLNSTDGHLTQIERGVPGRVFGLLTFTSLPRRLLLDFGDLFSRGIEFRRIEGSFAIESGNAYTHDLVMDSDTALIEVVGRTGLVDGDYDNLITVTPKISSGLPFVPIWILQKLLDRNVFDKAFAYQYTVTGPWDDPAIDLVRTQRLEGGEE